MEIDKLLRNKKVLAGVICGIIASTAATTTYAMEQVSPGWHGSGDNKYFINEDGARVTGWLVDEEFGVYYFDENRQLQTGWATIDNQTYYFDEVSGKLSVGETLVGSDSYFFQLDGRLLKGWQEQDTRYYNEFGYSLTGSQTIDNKTFRFNAEGKLYSGWVVENNKSMYFDAEGVKVTGLQVINGMKFYFDDNGFMLSGEEVTIDDHIYYFDKDGTIRTGWYTNKDGNKYYYDNDGNIQLGIQEIEGTTYFFKEDGTMMKDDKAEGYTFDAFGVGTKEEVSTQATETTSTAPQINTPAAPSIVGGSAMNYAMSAVGRPYVYGGSSWDGFDCSGLMQWAYAQAGTSIPRTAGAQLAGGQQVSYDQMQPGDIIVWNGGGHSSMYIGGGQQVHAVNPSTGVIVDAVSSYTGFMSITGIVRY